MLDNRKPLLLPEHVLELLKMTDYAIEHGALIKACDAHKLRELVTVWLRVAALHELVERSPFDFDPEMRCAVDALLFGTPAAEDTEPNHEAPAPPYTPNLDFAAMQLEGLATLKCTCGFHGAIRPFPSETHEPDYHCPECGLDLVQ